MENTDNTRRGGGRIWLALVLVGVGATLFLQQMGLPLPEWLFNWQMLLILIGIVTGFSNGFRGAGWAIMILIGGIFMLDDLIPGFSFHRFAWPLVIVCIGVLMLVRPHRHAGMRMTDFGQKWKDKDFWKQKYQSLVQDAGAQQSFASEDYVDSTSVFGGVKKVILSKNFIGGDITIFMGACEIDLTQADFPTRAVIDVTQIFGGTKLIVPAHWKISTQMTAVFGSIEDKRQQPVDANAIKTLVIQGTSVFGGIEIRNF
jgi:predicted membrane protein